MDHRIAQLARQKLTLLHTKDLGILWNIQNTNTLYTTLKRYVQRGVLHRVYKGLYSLVPLKEIDPFILGISIIHDYAYLSTETILSEAGVLPQIIYSLTFMSSRSLQCSVAGTSYRFRKLKDLYLHNPIGIYEERGLKKATLERAAADLVYFNPKVVLTGWKLINLKKLKEIQHEVGYPLKERDTVNPS